MKKIGIISLYHNSRNYGGLLQAYAMVDVLREMGYDAEQIDYNNTLKYQKTLKCLIKRVIKQKDKSNLSIDIDQRIVGRNLLIDDFRNSIPHSIEYNDNTISSTINLYDCFICGSDQIWNYYFNDVYYLNFVPESKLKISYAASMQERSNNNKVNQWICKSIRRLNYISVREVDLIAELSDVGKTIENVLDPTLLLSKKKWIDFANVNTYYKNYILVYFLGNNIEQQRIVKQFAERKGLDLYYLPLLNRENEPSDKEFSDSKKLFNIGPRDLISLIVNAEYIFTDSFHISLFSSLFEKKFISFSRTDNRNMDIRIRSLLKIFDNSYRFIRQEQICDPNIVFSNIEKNYKTDYLTYQQMYNKSLLFLSNALESIR